MQNRHVLITGGTRNIGYATALYFAQKGFHVHLTGRKKENAEAAASAIRQSCPGISVYSYACDISSVQQIVQLFQQIRENTPVLDAFVANAGHLGIGYDIFTTDEAAFDEIVGTNLKGTFFCCQEAGKMLAHPGGSIVLISSVQAKGAVEGRTVYGLTKGAISTLGKYLAFDFAPFGIRVNTAIVGAVHTERWDGLSPETAAKRRANYPLGREAYAEEIANAVYYLAVEQTAVTGSEMTLDSGVSVPLLPYRDRDIQNFKGYQNGGDHQ